MSTSMIIANLVIGPLLTILALVFRAYKPKNINALYGYRTSRSMKSQEAWDAANSYSFDLMLWVGILTTVSQVILYFFLSPANALLTACIIMSLLLIGIIIKTESYLKANFDEKGDKK